MSDMHQQIISTEQIGTPNNGIQHNSFNAEEFNDTCIYKHYRYAEPDHVNISNVDTFRKSDARDQFKLQYYDIDES
jgi:hypothetical protein